ncbi:hypothetical protein HZH66_013336 [Vespula vulgaris]|uniref:Uncharacterized protein n=1 Tax=Vespula vulgaris TaxID=7454 RepID=A0A834J9K3_VESVU|nr:hypothetical protein HZH66_013336 [Vespula vulgaris]
MSTRFRIIVDRKEDEKEEEEDDDEEEEAEKQKRRETGLMVALEQGKDPSGPSTLAFPPKLRSNQRNDYNHQERTLVINKLIFAISYYSHLVVNHRSIVNYLLLSSKYLGKEDKYLVLWEYELADIFKGPFFCESKKTAYRLVRMVQRKGTKPKLRP